MPYGSAPSTTIAMARSRPSTSKHSGRVASSSRRSRSSSAAGAWPRPRCASPCAAARGDAATAIGVNMHLAAILNICRQRQVAITMESQPRRTRLAGSPWDRRHRHRPGGGDQRAGRAGSVPPGDHRRQGRRRLGRQRHQALRHDVAGGDGRHRRRHLSRFRRLGAVRLCHRAGEPPGVEFHDDWDALGMRASASGSVSFHDVRLGSDAVRDGFTTGVYSVPMLDRYWRQAHSTRRRRWGSPRPRTPGSSRHWRGAPNRSPLTLMRRCVCRRT